MAPGEPWRYAFPMRTRAVRLLAVVVPAVLVAAAALAADPKPADPSAEEPVKVYTNADLERMFGPPAPSEPKKQSAEEAARDQKFLEAFFEREHKLIQADQEMAMRRRAMDQQSEPPAQESYTMGYAPYYGWWDGGYWQGGDQGGGHGGRNHDRPRPTPYFSPYAPKPGQPGWNELVLSHPWKSPVHPRSGSNSGPQPGKGRR